MYHKQHSTQIPIQMADSAVVPQPKHQTKIIALKGTYSAGILTSNSKRFLKRKDYIGFSIFGGVCFTVLGVDLEFEDLL